MVESKRYAVQSKEINLDIHTYPHTHTHINIQKINIYTYTYIYTQLAQVKSGQRWHTLDWVPYFGPT